MLCIYFAHIQNPSRNCFDHQSWHECCLCSSPNSRTCSALCGSRSYILEGSRGSWCGVGWEGGVVMWSSVLGTFCGINQTTVPRAQLSGVRHLGPLISLRALCLPTPRCCTVLPDFPYPFLCFCTWNRARLFRCLRAKRSERVIMSCLDVMYPAYGHYAPYAHKASAFISTLPVSMDC